MQFIIVHVFIGKLRLNPDSACPVRSEILFSVGLELSCQERIAQL